MKKLVALIVACVLVAGLVPATALARTAAGDLGLRLEVPASAFVDQGDGTRAADALVGLRLQVPKQAFAEPGDDTRSTSGMLGLRLQVPSQAYIDPGTGEETRAAEGMLGIRLEVPKQAFVDPGDGTDVRAAEGLFGIRLEVPSQAFVDPGDDTRSADGLVGIRLQVPQQAYVEPGDDTRAASGLFGIRLEVATTHTVTFDPNGGTGGKSMTVLDGAAVDEPDPVAATRDGWRVEGWYLDAACTERYDFALPVYRDFTLFANWVEEEYELADLRLHLMGDDAMLPDAADYQPGTDEHGGYLGTSYKVGKGMTLPTPTRTGYAFAGWHAAYDADAGYVGEPVEYVSRHDEGMREFWAKWEPLPPPDGEYWTVTFDVLGGTSIEPQYVDKGTGGTATRPADPARSGYEFDGWYADPLCMRPFDFATPIERDTVIYAKWKRMPGELVTSYLVAFDSRGGSTVGRQQVREGAMATRPADPTRTAYDFVGWYVSAEAAEGAGAEGVYDFAAPVTGNLTLYAGWREKPKLTITFDANGGRFDAMDDEGNPLTRIEVKVTEGAMVAPEDVPADPKQPGWQFAGWRLAAESDPGDGAGGGTSGVVLGDAWDPTSAVYADATIYADWSLRLDVTVPVSIGLAVDAGTGAVTAPGMGEYALKSRTVRPVEVESLALRSEQPELEGFFELPEGALPDGASEADRLAAWRDALASTRLTLLADAPGAAPIGLPLAGDADGSAWRSAYALADAERAAYRMAAFGYAGTAFDELWQGADPSERLPLELGMSIPSDKLGVRTDLDGEHPITRLQVTVAARE